MATDESSFQGDGEKLGQVHEILSKGDPSASLKTTKTGILLVPQPTDDPDEPLVSF